jgi:hypothetical protein
MTTVEKFDSILNTYTHGRTSMTVRDIEFQLSKNNIEISQQHIIEILGEMIDDKYIRIYPNMEDGKPLLQHLRHYCITLKGESLKQEGGYTMKIHDENARKSNQLQREKWLLYGTWFAGVWAMALVVIEIVKRWKLIYSIAPLRAFFLISAGVCIGLISPLLWRQIQKKKR